MKGGKGLRRKIILKFFPLGVSAMWIHSEHREQGHLAAN